jgi:hypothetical protein
MRGFFLPAFNSTFCVTFAPHPSPLPREREPTEMSHQLHRPERPSRLWIRSGRRNFLISHGQPPLPLGEGADRDVWRYASTCKIESIMDSPKNTQVGVTRQSPTVSPLSLRERARVRAASGSPHTQTENFATMLFKSTANRDSS